MYNQRIIDEAIFIISKGATVRQTAMAFGISKSTIHKDVSQKLYYIDKDLFDQVKLVLEKNFQEKHIRGGLATKNKFLQKKSN